MKLAADLFKQYSDDPLGQDECIRKLFNLPANRYYAVTVYPPERAGELRLTLEREVKTKKISKSDL